MTHQVQKPATLQDFSEPGVIDKEMLLALIVEQGPKGEAAKIFIKDGINLNNVTEIRIEFLNILNIDYLWTMPNLTKLSLSNNIIEKIENLNELKRLRELDLSFNRIRGIDNIDHLIKLEILLLHNNNIALIEGIDTLEDLTILNIAKNQISDWKHVTYLRKFKKLRSFNSSDNPCTEIEGYKSYLFACLPQIIYYQYQMIKSEERESAVEEHSRTLRNLQESEAAEKEISDQQQTLAEKITLLSKSFVEYLDEDSLFQQLFLHDTEGNALAAINDDTKNAFEEYKKTFSEICNDLYNLGLEEEQSRQKEIDAFNDAVNKDKDNIQSEARKLVDDVLEWKINVFAEIKESIKEISTEIETDEYEEKMQRIQQLYEEFNDKVAQTWTKFMAKEVTLHDQMEEIYETFTLSLTEKVNTFLESAQGYFSQMRNAEAAYNDHMLHVVLFHISGFSDENKMPDDLLELCGDKDILSNSLATSRDKHTQVIDGREDLMLRRLKGWCEDFVNKLLNGENERNRQQILEISHFMKSLREEFDSLQLMYQLQFDDIDPDLIDTIKQEY